MLLSVVLGSRRIVASLAFFVVTGLFVVLPSVEVVAAANPIGSVAETRIVGGSPQFVATDSSSESGFLGLSGSLVSSFFADALSGLSSVAMSSVAQLVRGALVFVPPPVDPGVTVELDPALVTSVAGDGTSAVVDGLGGAASFGAPVAVVVADEGAAVVDGHSLRLVNRTDFDVDTWVGDPATAGCVDSVDPAVARLSSPEFVASDLTSVFVVDSCSVSGGSFRAIRRVDLVTGAVDSLPGAAQDIPSPRGMVYAPDGYLYVTTFSGFAVRQVDPVTGSVSIVYTASQLPEGIAADVSDLYVLAGDSMVRVSLTDFAGTTFLSSLDVDPGVLVSAGDYLYGVDGDRDYLKRWEKADGSEITVAGAGAYGFADGVENEAWFGYVADLATDGDKLWIVDSGNFRVRTATLGTALPRGLTPFSDTDITSMSGTVVTTIETTLEDGDGDPANNPSLVFSDVRDVAVIGGDAYVANRDAIYRVDLASGVGELLAGVPGTPGCSDSVDPAQATFDIVNMTTDGYWLYVFNDHVAGLCDGGWSGGTQLQLRRVSSVTGAVSPLRVFDGFDDMAVGPDGLVYVATGASNSARVRWIDPASVVFGDVLPDPMAYDSFNAVAAAVAADNAKLWLVNDGLNGPNRLWSFEFPDYTESMIRDDHPRDARMVSAGSSLIQYGGTTVSVVDKADGSSVTVAGNGLSSFVDAQAPSLEFSSIAGAAHDGEAIYVVDSGTDRLRMIVDAFNPPGGFAMGYDGYGGWRDGVNAGLGNFVWSETDAAIATAGPELTVARTYNSSDPRVGPFGVGWTYSFDMRWRADSWGNVTVLFPDGRRETHVPDGSGGWLAPEGSFSELTGDTGSGFVLTMKDDTAYTFDSGGALTLITDANGHTLTLTYDTSDQLVTVTSSVSGRALSLTWSGGYISEIATDPVTPAGGGAPASLVWKYYYSGDQLTESCDPRDNTQTTGVCHTYSYTNRKITEITKPEGNVDARIGYFPSGEVQWRQDGEAVAGGYQTSFVKPQPDRVRITDGRGNVSTQMFDDKYRLVEDIDPTGKSTLYTYDVDGNRDSVADANGHTSTMTYDTDGNMKSVTNGELKTSYFEYDLEDNLKATRDGRSVDANDDTYKTSFTYDTVGNKLSETDALGNTQTWEYTDGTELAFPDGLAPAGLLKNYREARGNVGVVPDDAYATTYAYYGNGDLAKVLTPSGFETVYTYDELGRLLTEAITDPAAGISSQVVATYTYDEAGNTVTATGPVVVNTLTGSHQLATTNTFDTNSNLTMVTESDVVGSDPDRVTQMLYDLNDREYQVTDPEQSVVLREYDEVGNVIKVTDQNGTLTETIYDSRNLATDVWLRGFEDGHGAAARDIQLSHVTYDDAGRKLSETDAAGRVTQWGYDNADRVQTVTRLGFDDHTAEPLRDVVLSLTTYDDAGNVETQTTGDGTANQAIVTNTYDNAGRLDTSTLEMGVNDRVTDFDYDEAGNVTQVTRSQGAASEVTQSTFDVAGRLIRSTVDPAGTNLVTYYDYDARGNQTGVRDARSASGTDDTFLTTTEYDLLSRPIRLISPTVDVEEYNATPVTGDPQRRIGYDTYSNRTAVEDERGYVTISGFDRLGRLIDVRHPDYAEADPANGELDPSTWIASGYSPSNAWAATDANYSTYWSFGSGVRSATFDLTRIVPLETIQFWEYYADGRTYYDVQLEISVDGVVWETVYGPVDTAFDAGGVTVALSATAPTRFLRVTSAGSTGNSGNHLVEIDASACSDCAVETFAYDPVGNLTSQTSRRGYTTSFVFDDLNRVAVQTDPLVSGETTAGTVEFFYNDVGEQTAVVDQQGGRTEWGHDQLGRVNQERVIVTQDPGTYTWVYDYDDLGNRTYVEEPSTAVTNSVFNAASERVSVTDDSNETALFEYDLAGRTIKQTDRAGRITESDYDDTGRLEETRQMAVDGVTVLSTTGYVFDEVGNLKTITSPRGFPTTYNYDELSRLKSVTVPANTGQTITTSYGYDLAGNQTLVTDGRNNDFWTTYNSWNLPQDVIEPSTTAHPILADRTWTTIYDAGGLPVQEVQPGGVIITRSFDELGRMVTETGTGGSQDATRVFGYDLASRVTTVSHPSGDLTYTYDDRGLMQIATGPAGNTTYDYDPNGRMIERVDGAGVSTFTWTNRNELDTLTDPVTGLVLDYDWTVASELDTITYGATGLVRDYDYDQRGLVESDTLTNGATVVASFGYQYDADGNLEQKTVNMPGNAMTGVHNYTYGDGGRLESWDAPGQAIVTYEWDDSGNRTAAGANGYTYDTRNRLTTGPDGAYSYDPRGTLNQAGATSYSFDGLGRLSDFDGEIQYSYDGLDRVARRITVASGGLYTTTVTADAPLHYWRLDEPDGSTIATDSGSVPDDGLYVYSPTLGVDAAVGGTAMEITDWADRKMSGTQLTDQSFTMEFLARPDDVSRAFQVAVTNAYYDLTSNYGWTVMNDAGRFKLWFGANLVVTSDVDLVAGEWTHVAATFDDASDTASLWVNGQQTSATWTSSLNMTPGGVLKVGGQIASYNRHLRWFGGGLDELAYWDQALDATTINNHLAAFNGLGEGEFTYPGMGIDPTTDNTFTYSRTPNGRLIAQTDGVDTRVAGLDRHGDLNYLLNPTTGTLTDTRVFDPFGAVAAATGVTGQTLGFQADYTDPVSGDVWMGTRWYSATDAAFRSRDTVFGELETPVSLNRYTYGWANPLSFWDPDGRMVSPRPLVDGYCQTSLGCQVRAAVEVIRDASDADNPNREHKRERDIYEARTRIYDRYYDEQVAIAEETNGRPSTSSELLEISVRILSTQFALGRAYQDEVSAEIADINAFYAQTFRPQFLDVSAGTVGSLVVGGGVFVAAMTLVPEAAPWWVEVLAGAGASVASGQTATATGNVMDGRPIMEGLFDPTDMALEATIGGAAVGAGQLIKHIRTAIATNGIDEAATAFHHTTDELAELIGREGLRPGSYVTPDELSPLQAHIELALNPAGGARNAVLEVDLAGLRSAGFEVPAPTRVTSAFGMPGGGYEIQFPYAIPPEFIKVIQP